MAQKFCVWILVLALGIGITYGQNDRNGCSCDQMRQCLQQKHDQMDATRSTCESTCSKQHLNGVTKQQLESCKPKSDQHEQFKQKMDSCLKQQQCPSGSSGSRRKRQPNGEFGGQPQFGGFGGQSQFGGFGGQPPLGGFGGQGQFGGFGGQRQFGGFGDQPQFGGFGGQGQFGGFGGQPPFGGFDGPPPGPPPEMMNLLGGFHNCMRTCMDKARPNGKNNNSNNGGRFNQNSQRPARQAPFPFGGPMGPPNGGPEMDCADQLGCDLDDNVMQQLGQMHESCRPQMGNNAQRPQPPTEAERQKSCVCMRDLLGKSETEVPCTSNFNGGNFQRPNFNRNNNMNDPRNV